ncbi:MAG: hypothetical protein ACPG52_03940 [Cognaticolwellia sp.]
MSPEQLKTLQQLSQLFEAGAAGPSQIKQLSALLAEINQATIWPEEKPEHIFSRP